MMIALSHTHVYIHTCQHQNIKTNDKQPLSALDLLSINNLVNYFGKTEASDNVEVRPLV
jgi:hypothetical protein